MISDYHAHPGSDWVETNEIDSDRSFILQLQVAASILISNRVMKKFKQAEASDHEDEIDMISNLPDDVLHLILSCIASVDEIIRTSILSRRWRYLWNSFGSIDIDSTRGRNPLTESELNGFKDFVDWVLAKKSLDLNSFRLRCENHYNMSTIDEWIHAAVMRKVKVVDLMFSPKEVPEVIELPQCLVTCSSLEVLKLCLIYSPLGLPTLTGFPALRVLELKEVDLYDDDIVKYFLESCPLLEDLSLIDCMAEELVISSPKLKSLRIDTRQFVSDEEAEAEDAELDLGMCNSLEIFCPRLEILNLTGYVALKVLTESLCSLKKVVIHPKDLFHLDTPDFDLFARNPHVESLSTSLDYIRQGYNQTLAPTPLPNLRNLELTVNGERIDVLIPFLTCLPDLKSLHLIIPKDKNPVGLGNLAKAATSSILTRHLKKVEFVEFDEEKEKVMVARALLEHGKALEEMVFSWVDKARFHERSEETMNQVSKFQKASSTLKLRRAVIDPSQAKSTE